ncbi:MAG: choice-of-anchor H family protein [Gammaproteobacteria bacterium]|nr:choice-of-anchor H family protein [Gammaproteobacteria bacterium]MBL7000908.1 choice-of-anchor H family protein [Gammaproteobacteria bacterium]
MRTPILLLLACFAGLGEAAEPMQVTRSAALQPANSTMTMTEKLQSSPVIQFSTTFKTRDSAEQTPSAPNLQYRHATDLALLFSLYDAQAELSGDLDYDGYFHRIKISFDADTDSPLETVYAKLYLSHQGGAWKQYASSDLFEIHYDASDDRYEVISELIEGYQPGYYDVLIELYSLYQEGVVASRIVDMDGAGFALSLEDLEHDEYSDDAYYYSDYGASGSFSWAGIVLLGILLLIKRNYFTTPKNKKP